MTTNTLYYGDNLDILRRYVADETVDLVYLDPPFNSKATYNVLFQEKDGSAAAAQIEAFDDFWHWDQAAAEAYRDVVESGGQPAEAMRAFRTLLGPNDMLPYLAMMAPRLMELRRGDVQEGPQGEATWPGATSARYVGPFRGADVSPSWRPARSALRTPLVGWPCRNAPRRPRSGHPDGVRGLST